MDDITINYLANVTKLEVMNGIFTDEDLKEENHLQDETLTITAIETGSDLLEISFVNKNTVTSNTQSVLINMKVLPAQYANIGGGKQATVEITATDASGQAATSSFDVNITNNYPTIDVSTYETGTETPISTNSMSVGDEFDIFTILKDLDEEENLDASNVAYSFSSSGDQNFDDIFNVLTEPEINSKDVPTEGGIDVRQHVVVLGTAVSGVVTVDFEDECGMAVEDKFNFSMDVSPPTINIETSVTINEETITGKPIGNDIAENAMTALDTWDDTEIYYTFSIEHGGGSGDLYLSFAWKHDYPDSTEPLKDGSLYYSTGGIWGSMSPGEWVDLNVDEVTDGAIKFIPARGWNGEVFFAISAKDNEDRITTVEDDITITSVNTAPVEL